MTDIEIMVVKIQETLDIVFTYKQKIELEDFLNYEIERIKKDTYDDAFEEGKHEYDKLYEDEFGEGYDNGYKDGYEQAEEDRDND